ncbi:MAG TPA: 3'(2'),5'-bisphosphate nucleotidase CysQ [Methylocystis sp.]|nr:3'(2'),5'-bisphosphate nucleotidase CysQ [Methylocystis sp.]
MAATPDERDAMAAVFAELCLEAGPVVMEVFSRPRIDSQVKRDDSPVTEADERAEALLLERLASRFPDLPVIAEESAARGETPFQDRRFLLVDPLDGTREFLARRPEFTINVGLVEDGEPKAGAVYAPALRQIWFGGAHAFRLVAAPGTPLAPRGDWREIRARKRPAEGLTALVSRSHLDAETEAFLARQNVKERTDAGSSLKFCRIAEGAADVYPRFGPTMEWDTAAGDAVLRAAGGVVLTPEGAPLRYGKRAQDYRNGPFIAYGDATAVVPG